MEELNHDRRGRRFFASPSLCHFAFHRRFCPFSSSSIHVFCSRAQSFSGEINDCQRSRLHGDEFGVQSSRSKRYVRLGVVGEYLDMSCSCAVPQVAPVTASASSLSTPLLSREISQPSSQLRFQLGNEVVFRFRRQWIALLMTMFFGSSPRLHLHSQFYPLRVPLFGVFSGSCLILTFVVESLWKRRICGSHGDFYQGPWFEDVPCSLP